MEDCDPIEVFLDSLPFIMSYRTLPTLHSCAFNAVREVVTAIIIRPHSIEPSLVSTVRRQIQETPVPLREEIGHVVIQLLKSVRREEIDLKQLAAENAVQLIFDDQLRSLDLLGVDATIQHLLLPYIDGLTNLRSLKMSTDRYRTWDGVMTAADLVHLMKRLQNLTELILHNGVNDKLLYLLSRYCLKLRSIDCSGSFEVTDHGVWPLLSLPDLKLINLRDSQVTEEPIVQLLIQSKLWSIGPWEHIGDVLNTLFVNGVTRTQLKSITNAKITSQNEIQLISRLCPDLEVLSLVGDFQKVYDLSALSPLRQLTRVSLQRFNFTSDGVDCFLAHCGHQLQSFDLKDIMELGNDSFVTLGLNCPNLIRLGLNHCNIERSEPLPAQDDLFPNLRSLDVYSATSESQFLFLVTATSRELRVLRSGVLFQLTDEFVAQILKTSKLEKLQRIHFASPDQLTVDSLIYILRSCGDLELIEGFEFWNAFDEAAVLRLRQIGHAIGVQLL